MVSHRSKESRKIKGVLDEVDLNTLILSSVVCFFVTFGVKATQSTKENAIKNFVVLVGGIVLFGLLMATGNQLPCWHLCKIVPWLMSIMVLLDFHMQPTCLQL